MYVHTGTHRSKDSKSENQKILNFLFPKDSMIRAAVFGEMRNSESMFGEMQNSKALKEVTDLVHSRSSRKQRGPAKHHATPVRLESGEEFENPETSFESKPDTTSVNECGDLDAILRLCILCQDRSSLTYQLR